MDNTPKHKVKLGGHFWVLTCHKCRAEWNQVHYAGIAEMIYRYCPRCGTRGKTDFVSVTIDLNKDK